MLKLDYVVIFAAAENILQIINFEEYYRAESSYYDENRVSFEICGSDLHGKLNYLSRDGLMT